ncbi:MAG: glycosyltransferase family 39 protein [Armatimonadetes bacterium]|nr:glycosyltransferase family 39 protein [Armatimonadota bacterium]
MERLRGKHTVLVLALILGLALRIVWLSAVNSQPVTDFDWYFHRAVSLANGTGYSVDGVPTAYWPVGYPAALALVFKVFGASVLTGKVFNTLLTLACVALSWRVALRLFKDLGVANSTAVIVAVHPSFVAYSGILASEPLFTALTLFASAACLLCPMRNRAWLIGAGIAFGFATLVRPQALLVPALVCLCARFWDSAETYRGHAGRAVLIVYCVVAVVLLPWTIRNAMVFGAPVFVSTNGGDNLLIGNSKSSNGLYKNPDSLGYDLSGLGEVERDKKAARYALRFVATHPGQVTSLWPKKLWGTFLSSTDAAYWAFQKKQGLLVDPGTGEDKPLFKTFQAVCAVWIPTLLALAGLGALAGWRWSRLPGTALVLIAYTALLTLVFFGNPRFGFAVAPFLSMHASHGLVLLVGRLKRKKASGEPPEASNSSEPLLTPE